MAKKKESAVYMVSISSTTGVKGAILIEFDSCPDIQATRIEPNGIDVKDMGLNKYHTAEEMKHLGY